jgi:hypothetical protein
MAELTTYFRFAPDMNRVSVSQKLHAICVPSAEVLTDHGWIQFQNLDITEHKVATLREDKFLDYVVP